MFVILLAWLLLSVGVVCAVKHRHYSNIERAAKA